MIVHQGVYTVIFSIILAVFVLVVYFRSDLNFFKGNKSIKALAVAWIVQNLILILTTAGKNYFYVTEYSLTYKRIGVYFYLIICSIGLLLTLIKLLNNKSHWYLIRKNAIAVYVVMVLSCFVNWDLLITRFNLTHSKNPDLVYLHSLSHSSFPDILKYLNSHPDVENSALLKQSIISSAQYFKYEYGSVDWRSFNFEDERVKSQLDILLNN